MPYVENLRFLHICHVETSEMSPQVEKFLLSPQLSNIRKAEISPHDNFFSTYNISDINDKYQVCIEVWLIVD